MELIFYVPGIPTFLKIAFMYHERNEGYYEFKMKIFMALIFTICQPLELERPSFCSLEISASISLSDHPHSRQIKWLMPRWQIKQVYDKMFFFIQSYIFGRGLDQIWNKQARPSNLIWRYFWPKWNWFHSWPATWVKKGLHFKT